MEELRIRKAVEKIEITGKFEVNFKITDELEAIRENPSIKKHAKKYKSKTIKQNIIKNQLETVSYDI